MVLGGQGEVVRWLWSRSAGAASTQAVGRGGGVVTAGAGKLGRQWKQLGISSGQQLGSHPILDHWTGRLAADLPHEQPALQLQPLQAAPTAPLPSPRLQRLPSRRNRTPPQPSPAPRRRYRGRCVAPTGAWRRRRRMPHRSGAAQRRHPAQTSWRFGSWVLAWWASCV